MSAVRFYNRTRQTEDLRKSLVKRREWLAVWLHDLLQKSYLGREGISHSGSYLFADHIYRNQPKGEGWLGHSLDYILLNLPLTRAMRRRCDWATEQILAAYQSGSVSPFHLLTVPCGIPREVARFVERTNASGNCQREINYLGIDLDPTALDLAENLRPTDGIKAWQTAMGDALAPQFFPAAMFDCVASTGLGEFLSDSQLADFYRNIFSTLAPGGVFCTTNLRVSPWTVWLLNKFELIANYRTANSLARIFELLPWSALRVRDDGRQVYVVATK